MLEINTKILATTLTPMGLLMAITGLFLIARKNILLGLTLSLWILIPFFLYTRLLTTAPRFFVILLPPLFISIGVLLSRFWRLHKVFQGISLGSFLILFLLPLGDIFPLLYFRHHHALLPDYVKWVQQITEPNARIITGDDSAFFKYYTQRQTMGRPLKTTSPFTTKELQDVKSRLDKLLQQNIPVYITFIGLYDYDPKQQFAAFLEKHYQLDIIGKALYEDWHAGATVRRVFYNPLVKITPKPSI